MSNTLILIIAADYGAFSSSNKKQDLYQEYVRHSQARNYASSYVPKYDEQVHKQCINPKQELGCKVLEEKKEIVFDQNIPERVLEIVAINQPKKPSEFSYEKRPALHLHDGNGKIAEKATPARIYQRSKSDRSNRVKHVVVNEQRVEMVQRSETVKVKANVEEENEFSKMSNEDLNRRIEEFIHKFKSQAIN
ncbi:hypothetical protein ACSQ67_012840 [Phaseolus vulgaris]